MVLFLGGFCFGSVAAWSDLRAAGIVLVKLGKFVRIHKACPEMQARIKRRRCPK
jgi:hypothetical protein